MEIFRKGLGGGGGEGKEMASKTNNCCWSWGLRAGVEGVICEGGIK